MHARVNYKTAREKQYLKKFTDNVPEIIQKQLNLYRPKSFSK